ncbi:hypothetical protein MMPV_004024 [Pyropia vietnamensis]
MAPPEVASMELPLIDLAALVPDATPPLPVCARTAALASLRGALSAVGFFHLTNHGICSELQTRLLAAVTAFFDLPAAEKEAVALRGRPGTGRGYQRLRESVTAGSADVHEAVDIYATVASDDASLRGAVTALQASAATGASAAAALTELVTADNPTLPSDLHALLNEYVAAARVAAAATLGVVAEAAGLDAATTTAVAKGAFWNARLISYPPVGAGVGAGVDAAGVAVLPPPKGELGCGAHCDYGLLTFVAATRNAASRGCLQVWSPDAGAPEGGVWVAADPPPGAPADTLVVNVGDWLAAATGGAIRSSRHRVVSPSRVGEGEGDDRRISVPFFFEPALDARPPGAMVAATEAASKPTAAVGKQGSEEGTTASATTAAATAAATTPSSLVTHSGRQVSCYGEFLLSKVATNFAFETAGGGGGL